MNTLAMIGSRPRRPIQTIDLDTHLLQGGLRTSLRNGVFLSFITLFPASTCPEGLATEYTARSVVEYALTQAKWPDKGVQYAVDRCLRAFNNGRPLHSTTEYMANGQAHFHIAFLRPKFDAACWDAFTSALLETGFMVLAKMHAQVPDAYALNTHRPDEAVTVLSPSGEWRLDTLCSTINYTLKQPAGRCVLNLTGRDAARIPSVTLTDKQFLAVLRGKAGALVAYGSLGLYTYRYRNGEHILTARTGVTTGFATGEHRQHLFEFIRDNGLSLDTTIHPTEPGLIQHLFGRIDAKNRIVLHHSVRVHAHEVENDCTLYGKTVRDVFQYYGRALDYESGTYLASLRHCAARLGVRQDRSGYVDNVALIAAFVSRIVLPALRLQHKQRIQRSHGRVAVADAPSPPSPARIHAHRQAP